jgi:hypothetical protein
MLPDQVVVLLNRMLPEQVVLLLNRMLPEQVVVLNQMLPRIRLISVGLGCLSSWAYLIDFFCLGRAGPEADTSW